MIDNERLDVFAKQPASADVCRKLDDVMLYLGVSEMRLVVEYAKRAAYLSTRRRFNDAHHFHDGAEFMTFEEFERGVLNT